jgi:hypothetical protein
MEGSHNNTARGRFGWAPMMAQVGTALRERGAGFFKSMALITATLLFSSSLTLAQFTQQGSKLVGTGAAGLAEQGSSVALSGDGGTAIVGGPDDNSYTGATWVFTRSGGVWTQQGNKLVGTGGVGPPGRGPGQGSSVAVSGDGNTAIVGGPYDNCSGPPLVFCEGAAWVFTHSGGAWRQQGRKLVGTDAIQATL